MGYLTEPGTRAATIAGGPVRIPIEGARAVADQGALLVLIGLDHVTDEECQAVSRGGARVAPYVAGPVVALAFQLSASAHTVEAVAPIDIHDPDADGDLGPAGHAVPLRFVLCDSASGVVRAVREGTVSARAAHTLRRGASVQRAMCATSSEVRQAAYVVVEALRPSDLLDHSAVAV